MAGGQVSAEWLNVPGNNAQVLNTAVTTPWLGSYVHAAGLQFFLDEGKTTQVAYSIPSRHTAGFGAQSIKFRARSNTGNPGIIEKAEIYNGDLKVATINGPWTLDATWRTINLNLGSVKPFPLGVSLVLSLTGGTGSSFYWFSGAGANFVNARSPSSNTSGRPLAHGTGGPDQATAFESAITASRNLAFCPDKISRSARNDIG